MSAHEHYILDGPDKGKSLMLPSMSHPILCIAQLSAIQLSQINPVLRDYVINKTRREYQVVHSEKTDFGYTHDLRQIL